jgi:hypothetical protein
MVMAAPLPHPRRPGTILLRAGFELQDGTIGRLEELGVRHLWIRYPGLSDLSRFVDPRIERTAAALADTLERATDAVVQDRHARLDYAAFRDAASAMLAALAGNPAAAFLLDELGPGTYEARHASNVCMTSLLLGLRLIPYVVHERARLHPTVARDITDLGVGAMLHDIGMLQLPREVRDRFAQTGDEADPEFRKHTELGFAVVKDWVSPASASIVLNHHQRFDGSGFPGRKSMTGDLPPPKGRQIHVFHRIVAGADLLDRLRYPPGGDCEAFLPTVRALSSLRQAPLRERLDPLILAAIFHCVPAFAPGTMVTLSDGGQAAVVDWHPMNPCRPTVQRIETLDPADADEEERIDLRNAPDLSIALVGETDVRGDIFEPEPDELSLSKYLKRLENRADDLAA